MSKPIPVPISISCSRDNHDEFHIRVRDNDAVDSHVEITLTPKQFAYLISGQVVDGAIMEVRQPERFGKKRISEERTIECPITSYDRDKVKRWLIDNAQEEGWEIDSYLGSQNSVTHRDGGCLLRYRVKKWVEKDN